MVKHMRRRARGFTLIELLVVLAALGLLLALAGPRYVEHVDRGRETALKHNLAQLRQSIDTFYADRARYPKDLQELVERGYLRAVPLDPVTDRNDTWVLLAPGSTPATAGATRGGTPPTSVADVRSGAPGNSREGAPYASW
jgi:general secretion pathway protein G